MHGLRSILVGAAISFYVGFILPLALTQVFVVLALATMECGSLRGLSEAFVAISLAFGHVLETPSLLLRPMLANLGILPNADAGSEWALIAGSWLAVSVLTGGVWAAVSAIGRRRHTPSAP